MTERLNGNEAESLNLREVASWVPDNIEQIAGQLKKDPKDPVFIGSFWKFTNEILSKGAALGDFLPVLFERTYLEARSSSKTQTSIPA